MKKWRREEIKAFLKIFITHVKNVNGINLVRANEEAAVEFERKYNYTG